MSTLLQQIRAFKSAVSETFKGMSDSERRYYAAEFEKRFRASAASVAAAEKRKESRPRRAAAPAKR